MTARTGYLPGLVPVPRCDRHARPGGRSRLHVASIAGIDTSASGAISTASPLARRARHGRQFAAAHRATARARHVAGDVEKVLGGNFMRVFGAVEAGTR